MPSILIVCSANICRSPMAEALLNNKLAGLPDALDWQVESAGVWAMEGSPAATRSQYVLRQQGLDLSLHRSQGVSRELLRRFNLILVMERNHLEALRTEFPQLAGRIYMLSEMIDRSHDIRDPIDGTLADYEDTVQEIDSILSEGMEKIISLASTAD